MLTNPMLARNLRLVIFEEESSVELEAAVEEWLEESEERTVVGASFDVTGEVGNMRWAAHILYTE